MTSEFPAQFACNYQCLLNRLKLHGMQPKTIALYSHGVRRAGEYFDYRIDDLTRLQLTDYFVHIVDSLSWSSLKHDLYGLKFYYAQVLNKPWPGADLVKPPKSHTLPDIITVPQAQQIFMTTWALSYRVFFFTLYSLGLRLGEGLRCKSGILMRTGCGCKCETPKAIETALSRCRRTPCRYCAVSGRPTATPHCSSLTVSADSKKPTWPPPRWIVVASRPPCASHPRLRFKKELRHTVCAIPMPPT